MATRALDSADDADTRGNHHAKRLTVDFAQEERSPEPSRQGQALSRQHWQRPTENAQCALDGCNKPLGVRNRMTHCRKCGKSFCLQHCASLLRLENGDECPRYSVLLAGVFGRCCPLCYSQKPDQVCGTQAGFNDLSSKYKLLRARHSENANLVRIQIRNRFINLANALVDKRLLETDWNNNHLTHCEICLIKFSLLLRKHHCRLCGRLVCNDPYAERKSCSIMVPLEKLVALLPSLAYNSSVARAKQCWNGDSPSFRCCIICKKRLLFGIERQPSAQMREYVSAHSNLLLLRDQVLGIMEKYSLAVETRLDTVPKLSSRAAALLKSFESAILQFKSDFMSGPIPQHRVAIANTYRAHVDFLQNSIVQFKTCTHTYQSQQEKALKEAQAHLQPKDIMPKITKKQIRELREQLMVMNEQKFLIEQMISDYTKQRKFHETESLRNNALELQRVIDDLVKELGEYGFE